MACGVNQQNQAEPIKSEKKSSGFVSVNGLPFPIAFTPKQANESVLTTGFYQGKGIVENPEKKTVFLTDEIITVDTESGKKRIKIDLFEVRLPKDGKSEFELKFQVIDNFIPVVPIFWAVAGVSGLTAGGFFFNELNKFTSSSAGTIVSIVAGIISLFLIVKFNT